MFRFDAKKGFYLYPEAENTEDLQLWMNKGSTYEKNVEPRNDICVTKHGLKIPNHADHYINFVERMNTYEKEFRKVVETHALEKSLLNMD